MKNFYACDDFFKTIIDVNVIALCITSVGYKDISTYKKWLVNLDWLEEISRLENLNLKPFEVQKLRSQATQKVNETTATTLAAKQEEWNAANRDTEATQSRARARRGPGRPRGMQGRNQDLRGGMLDTQAETEGTQDTQNVQGAWVAQSTRVA